MEVRVSAQKLFGGHPVCALGFARRGEGRAHRLMREGLLHSPSDGPPQGTKQIQRLGNISHTLCVSASPRPDPKCPKPGSLVGGDYASL